MKVLKYSVLPLTIALSACSSGGGNANSGDVLSSSFSNNIYDPASYSPNVGLDTEGLYVFIQDGTFEATVTFSETDHSDEVITDLLVDRQSRRVVYIEGSGHANLITDLCTGQVYGSLTAPYFFTESEAGRFDVDIDISEDHVLNMPSESSGEDPLYFGPNRDNTSVDFNITDYSADASFHLIRIGNVDVDLGMAEVHYSSGLLDGSFDACMVQQRDKSVITYPQYDSNNTVNDFVELVRTYGMGEEGFFVSFREIDSVLLGVGPIGSGSSAQISFGIETTIGGAGYLNNQLSHFGDTGAISFELLDNHSRGLSAIAEVEPDGSANFSEDSIEIDFSIEWPLAN